MVLKYFEIRLVSKYILIFTWILALAESSPIDNPGTANKLTLRDTAATSIEIAGCRSCPYKIMPVCAKDGYTYDNDCLAGCANAKVLRYGPCIGLRSDCECNLEWDPVCGQDGKTYYNMCDVDCADVEVVHEGQCTIDPDDCTCLNATPDLVCGEDGKTYSSPCEAKCAEAEIANTGPCPDDEE